MKKIFKYLKPYKKSFILSQIFMLVATISGLFFPWYLKSFFDAIFDLDEISMLYRSSIIIFLLFLVSHIANYLKDIRLGTIAEQMMKSMRDELYVKLQKLSIGYYSNQKTGDLVSRITNDMQVVQSSLTNGLSFLLKQSISLIFILYMLFRIDIVLTILVFVSFPIILLISKKMGKRTKVISRNLQYHVGDLTGMISESISGIQIMKMFVLEKIAKDRYEKKNSKVYKDAISHVRVKAKASCMVSLVSSVQLVLLIVFGGMRVVNAQMSPGDLVAFLLYVDMVVGPVSMLAGIYLEILKAHGALKRIFELMEAEESIVNKDNPLEPKRNEGDIVFENVSFAYAKDKYIIKNLNLDIKANSNIALVGVSGAGKSTILQLIPRFYDVSEGRILVDGLDIRDYDKYLLREKIGIVPQDTSLFGMSIKENILCGKVSATFDEVVDASKKANAHDFIMELEDGYDTVISERGLTLSGGQRQRIAIARAFLKNPKILLLDEATSALDTVSEKMVENALEKLKSNRTTITVAHRLSTITKADVIVVLHNGKIIAKGKHANLLKTSNTYKEAYESQNMQAIFS